MGQFPVTWSHPVVLWQLYCPQVFHSPCWSPDAFLGAASAELEGIVDKAVLWLKNCHDTQIGLCANWEGDDNESALKQKTNELEESFDCCYLLIIVVKFPKFCLVWERKLQQQIMCISSWKPTTPSHLILKWRSGVIYDAKYFRGIFFHIFSQCFPRRCRHDSGRSLM